MLDPKYVYGARLGLGVSACVRLGWALECVGLDSAWKWNYKFKFGPTQICRGVQNLNWTEINNSTDEIRFGLVFDLSGSVSIINLIFSVNMIGSILIKKNYQIHRLIQIISWKYYISEYLIYKIIITIYCTFKIIISFIALFSLNFFIYEPYLNSY